MSEERTKADVELAMHHLQEMCAAIFRIAKRDGVAAGRKELRGVIVALIETEKVLERRAHDVEQTDRSEDGA